MCSLSVKIVTTPQRNTYTLYNNVGTYIIPLTLWTLSRINKLIQITGACAAFPLLSCPYYVNMVRRRFDGLPFSTCLQFKYSLTLFVGGFNLEVNN